MTAKKSKKAKKTKKQQSFRASSGSRPTTSLQAAAQGWVEECLARKVSESEAPVQIFLLGREKSSDFTRELKARNLSWVTPHLQRKKQDFVEIPTREGVVWVYRVYHSLQEHLKRESDLRLKSQSYAVLRDLAGELYTQMASTSAPGFEIHLDSLENEALEGLVLGLEIASYEFRKAHQQQQPLQTSLQFFLNGKKLPSRKIGKMAHAGRAVNFARHLVNLPPNELNPTVYSQALYDIFAKDKNFKVEIWDEARLKKERMGLVLAVGRASDHPPRLVKLSYRSRGTKSQKPGVFVGKGITYDTGGLDLKPSRAMRLMKKDMGGSAAIAGLAYWFHLNAPKTSCDFYFSLAENSVGPGAFRSSDIIESRSGQFIEIHNTDAEGRLVMADALSLAAEEDCTWIIDVATLTGAIKVGLGSQIAGLFSNNRQLENQLNKAGIKRGELNWPMPLYQNYKSLLMTPVGHMVNASDGFGGAITAALFLESFVNGKPWAHLDIYAWADQAVGPYREVGASGQAVQTLIEFIEKTSK